MAYPIGEKEMQEIRNEFGVPGFGDRVMSLASAIIKLREEYDSSKITVFEFDKRVEEYCNPDTRPDWIV